MRYDGFLGLAYSWEEKAALEASEFVWNGLVLSASALSGFAFTYALRSLHASPANQNQNLFVQNVKFVWDFVTSPYRWVTQPIQTAKNFAYFASHMVLPQILTYQAAKSFDSFWHKAGTSFLRPSLERLALPIYNAIFDVDYELSIAPRGLVPNHTVEPGYVRSALRTAFKYSVGVPFGWLKNLASPKSEDDFVGRRYYNYGESFADACESTGSFLKDKAQGLAEAFTDSSVSQYVWDKAESLTEGNSIVGPKILLATPFIAGFAAYNAYRWWTAPPSKSQQQQQQINVNVQHQGDAQQSQQQHQGAGQQQAQGNNLVAPSM